MQRSLLLVPTLLNHRTYTVFYTKSFLDIASSLRSTFFILNFLFLIQRCWAKKNRNLMLDGRVNKPARAGRGEEIIDSADLSLTIIISVKTRLARLVGLETVSFDDTSCHDLPCFFVL